MVNQQLIGIHRSEPCNQEDIKKVYKIILADRIVMGVLEVGKIFQEYQISTLKVMTKNMVRYERAVSVKAFKSCPVVACGDTGV